MNCFSAVLIIWRTMFDCSEVGFMRIVLVQVVDRRERVLEFEVHAAGLEVGFRGALAVVDDLEERLQRLARLALLVERLPLAEFRIVDVEGAGVGPRAVFAADEQEEREGENSADHDPDNLRRRRVLQSQIIHPAPA